MSDQARELVQQLVDLAMVKVDSYALVILDPRGVILGWLAGAEKLFGYEAREIVGRHISLLFTPDDLDKDLANWEVTTSTESGMSEDDRWHLRRDGGKVWVSGTLTALRNGQDQLVGFAKIMRDQTDVKFQVESLESRIVAYELSTQSKNQFIATLGHELRNPLSAMSNATALLRTIESNNSDASLALSIVQRQIDFMGRIIKDLLEVARSAEGKVDIRKEPLILQSLVEQALETCQASIDERHHEVHLLLPVAPLYLQADSTRLRQVFINLIQNATKYMHRGGTIWIKVTSEGDEAVVRVQDTGMGIAPDVMPHIFELFTQAAPATNPQDGLGIGLSVVKDNVAGHGGTVQAASDGVGKGSEFTVRLPMMPTQHPI